jgi:hypothetical protein
LAANKSDLMANFPLRLPAGVIRALDQVKKDHGVARGTFVRRVVEKELQRLGYEFSPK